MAEAAESAMDGPGVTGPTGETVSALSVRQPDPREGIERVRRRLRAAAETTEFLHSPRKPCTRCAGRGFETVEGKPWATHHCRDCHGRGTVVDEEALRAQLDAEVARVEARHQAEQAVLAAARALVPELEQWYGSENAAALVAAVAELDAAEVVGRG
jgi:hypothetical protein